MIICRVEFLEEKSVTYLRFDIHSAKAVEELEGGEHLALHQDRRHNGGGRPIPSAGRHLEEPLFEWKLTSLAKASSQAIAA